MEHDQEDKGAMTYPSVPGWQGLETSRQAAEAIQPIAGALREQVLEIITNHEDGLTADEVAKIMDKSVLTIRPRVCELHIDGEIVPTEYVRQNDSGRYATVWERKKEE